MLFKVACVLVSSLMIQKTAAQAISSTFPSAGYSNEVPITTEYPAYGPIAASGLSYNPLETTIGPGVPGLTYGLSLSELSASNGGGLRVKSSSPMASTGVTVETDSMVIEGPLAVSGQLPFLGVVALEGPLPASGSGAVAYECGDGNVGIVNEGLEPLAPAYPNAAYPNGQLAPSYPNGQLAQSFPNSQLAPTYSNMPATNYPNSQFSNGFS